MRTTCSPPLISLRQVARDASCRLTGPLSRIHRAGSNNVVDSQNHAAAVSVHHTCSAAGLPGP